MSDINANITFTVTKGSIRISHNIAAGFDMAGADAAYKTQSIGTAAWEALNLGELAGIPPLMMVINTDATNFVELAMMDDGSAIFAKILAGKPNLFSPKSATIYAKANTAAVRVIVFAPDA